MATTALTMPQGEQVSMEQFGTTCHPINAPQWPHRVYVGPA